MFLTKAIHFIFGEGEENRGVFRSIFSNLFTVAALTLLVKGVALGKDLFVAGQFGTSWLMDVFIVAYLVPGLVAQLLSAVPDALLPVYADAREKEGVESANRVVSGVLWIYAVLLLLLMGILFAVAEPMLGLVGGIQNPEQMEVALKLFHILIPLVFLECFVAVFASVLQANQRFVITSTAPALIPATVLVVLLVWGDALSISSLAIGTVIGTSLQICLVVWGSIRYCGFRLSLFAKVDRPTLKRVGLMVAPLIAGEAFLVSSTFIDTTMAAWLGDGMVSTYQYALKVFTILILLATVSVGEVIFPRFSKMAAKEDWAGLRNIYTRFSGIIVCSSVLVSVLLYAFAPFIVEILFERGKFTPQDTLHVSEVLRFCTLQLPFCLLGLISNRTLVSMGRGKLLIGITLISAICNVFFNILFVKWIGLPGIALSTAGVYLVSGLIMRAAVMKELRRRME